MVEGVLKDLRYGLRVLLQSPGFSLVAILSLGLGIGVNTTIFSLVNEVLLRPLPVTHPNELVEIYTSGPKEFRYGTSSYPDYLDLRDQSKVFTGLLAYCMMPGNLSFEGKSELIMGEIVSGNYFDVLGVRAAVGRTFLPDEDRTPATHPVAVLGHGFWQRRFGADPTILGQQLKINGVSYTVIGIAPKRFSGTIPGLAPQLWVPMMMRSEVNIAGIQLAEANLTGDTPLQQRGNRWLFLKGRLKPGVSLAQARANLETIMARLQSEYPDSNQDKKPLLLAASQVRFHPMLDRILTPTAAVLMAVVGLVLLIACANVASMLLARASARRREIAVRLTLGATRGRLIRQFLSESILLSVLGGVGGLLLAYWATRLLLTFRPPTTSITLQLGIDFRVLLFTLSVSLLTGLLFGLAPALQLSRTNLVPALKNETLGSAGRQRRFSLRDLLVAGQLAVSLVLLIGAALLVRSLRAAQETDVGFDPKGLAVMEINLKMHGYSAERGKVFYRELLEKVRALPQVESAALTNRVPLDTGANVEGVYIDGRTDPADRAGQPVYATYVGTDYFKTFGIALLRGRDFSAVDQEDSPRVAIVNQAMARLLWPDSNPMGQRFHLESLDGPSYEIVGVARDYKVHTVGEAPRPYLHLARSQLYSSGTNLVARTRGDAAQLVATLRREMLALDPDLVFLESRTMLDKLAISLFPVRTGATLLAISAILALLLAAVGLYGVIAYSVSRRTREIGIRMALGARSWAVVRLVLRQGLVLALIGIGVGLVLASAASRVLSGLLYGVGAIDPLAFASAALLLLAVALLANYIPARRAARVDPMIALREE